MPFIANIKSKEEKEDGRLKVEVEFTDGEKTFTEYVIPQDSKGLEYFIKGRLKELDFIKEPLPIGEYVPPVKVDPVVPPDVLERNEWIEKVVKLSRIKNLLVDAEVLTEEEVGLDVLKSEIKNGFNADYLNYI